MEFWQTLSQHEAFRFGNRVIDQGEVLLAGFVIALVLAVWFVWRGIQRARTERAGRVYAEQQAQEMQSRMEAEQKTQASLAGQLQAFANMVENRQSDMLRNVSERLDGMNQRMGQSMAENSKNTMESLAGLQERLAVIDKALTNITALSDQVVGLQSILSNKQTRGAFGQSRMETIVKDGLPMGAYAFQATLSNGKMPDCLIFMPNITPPLAIDA